MRILGTKFEKKAELFLKNNALKLIDRNYHTRLGEIDLIMRDAQQLVFIEVRYRKSIQFGSPFESVTKQKMKRIALTAQDFIQKNKRFTHSSCRFDVVSITGPGDSDNEIKWLKDAFRMDDL